MKILMMSDAAAGTGTDSGTAAAIGEVAQAAGQLGGIAALVAPQYAPEIALAEAALGGAEAITLLVSAKIAQLKAAGAITPEAQAALKARIDAMNANLASFFSGPEWKVD